MTSPKKTSTSAGGSAPDGPKYVHFKDKWFLDFVVEGSLVGPALFLRSAAFPDAKGAEHVLPVGTILSFQKQAGGLLKLQTNVFYDICRLPLKGVKGAMVSIKNFAGYGSNMLRCRHFQGLYDSKSRPLPHPVEYLDLALKVDKERPVLPREYVFRLLPAPEGSSGLAQETPLTKAAQGSIIHGTEGHDVGQAGRSHLKLGPISSRSTSDGTVPSLASPDAGTHRVVTPKVLTLRCQGDKFSLRDETRRRESSGGEPTSSEKKRERQKAVREEVEEQTRHMKRMRGEEELMTGEDERVLGKRPARMRGGQEEGAKKRQSKKEPATASKKTKRDGGLTIVEGQALEDVGEGIAAAGEPSEKSKRKHAAEEGDRPKKARKRKGGEGTSGGEGSVGKVYDEAAAFWLEYERNDDGKIVEKEDPIQLVIDPRKVCDIPLWEDYYNHCSLKTESVDNIKNAMLTQFREEKGKIWTKNALVVAPIYRSVTERTERAQRVHKDDFKLEDKDKFFYYPINGQHTMAAVKELEGEEIFELWKMHSWPARVVWFSVEDFGGYVQVSLSENTRHKQSLQRSQKSAFLDMRDAWEKAGRPVAIQGNPSGKEAKKQAFFKFQKMLLAKSPNGAHWTMAQKATTLADKEKVAAICHALRQWMPLVTADDTVFQKGMEFYDKWAKGKLLGGDGKTPLSKPGKYMPEKSSGLQAIPEVGSRGAAGETKLGWLIRVPPPHNTKKTQMSDKFFVVVKEPDMFCWQSLADMTDNEQLSTLEDILVLKGVFVQSAGKTLKRQHKPGIKEMVAMRKVDRMMLRMFHYILFLEQEQEAEVWCNGSDFFRTEEALLAKFGPHGLTKQVNRVTSLIPFGYPPHQAHIRLTEIREIVRHYVCNVYVLDLCDPTLLKDWAEDDFAFLQNLLHTLSPRHWSLVVFFPSRWELSFLKGMAKLTVHHVRTGKWVRHAQKKATMREGNMLVEDYDRLYVVFNGENLADNTVAVFPAGSPSKPPRAKAQSPAKAAAAARSKVGSYSDPSGQAVACFDVADEDKFTRSQWEDGGVTSVRGAAYGDRERKPAHLFSLLENFCRVGQTVFFFGKAHASVVWELLRSGRNVVVLEDEARMILLEFVKTRVGDPRNHCSFVETTGERNWEPTRDLYWKLPEKKRMEVWEFLFQSGPPAQTDMEYNRRRNLVFGVLKGYHGAPRESVSSFLRRLEHVYFMLEEELTLENYKAQFDEDDAFDAEDMEEVSDSETFDFESMELPRLATHGDDEREHQGGSRRYSTSPGGLKRAVLLRQAPPVHIRGCLGPQCRLAPRIFQPAVKNGKWVMAIKKADGKWSGLNRLGAGLFRRKAKETLVEHLSVVNPGRSVEDVNAYAGQKLDELYDNKMLEFRAPFYLLDTAPSRGIDWRMSQPPAGGQHPGGGGGGSGGDSSGDGSDDAEGKGSGGEGSGKKSYAGKGSGETLSGSKGLLKQGRAARVRAEKGRAEKGWAARGRAESVGSSGASPGDLKATAMGVDIPICKALSPCSLQFSNVEIQDWSSRKVMEGPTTGVLGTGAREHQCHDSNGESVNLQIASTAAPGEEEFSQETHVVHREEQTQHSLPRKVLDLAGMPLLRRSKGASVSSLSSGERRQVRIDSELLASPSRPSASDAARATVQGDEENVRSNPLHLQLESGASEHQCHASECVFVDFENMSTLAPENEQLSQELNGVQREEELRQGSSRNTISIGETEEELRHGSSETTMDIVDTEEIMHSGSPLTTQEGDVEGGQWTFVEGEIRGEERCSSTLVEARLSGDEDVDEPLVEARVSGDAASEERFVDVRLLGDEEGDDHDSLVSCSGGEQGDRPSVLSSVEKSKLWKTSTWLATQQVKNKVIQRLSSVPVGKSYFGKTSRWLATKVRWRWSATQPWSRCRISNALWTLAQWRDGRPISLEGLLSTVRFVNSSTRSSVTVQLRGHPD
ncbi:hypothetical protein CBR_g31823 [Chara braunii]|uniref:Uncharacterized protein n=1 Tax=Chara braunii TaxID=69332 RepID=A0A388LFV6_CHABU|nr:hypothetical protein CBR_g31823 [Chara braunii]|eukprot:GBG81147.1 hypothetical protein CBR_g31823 [Chara braunii]